MATNLEAAAVMAGMEAVTAKLGTVSGAVAAEALAATTVTAAMAFCRGQIHHRTQAHRNPVVAVALAAQASI